MKDAVIVSTARTPIGRAYRGALNQVKSPSLMGHAIRHAVSRAGVEGEEIEDVIVGTVLTAGTAGGNIGRTAVFGADLPESVSGQTIDRQCASGLAAIATGAKQICMDGMDVIVAGGQENISAVQTPYFEWLARDIDPAILARRDDVYMPMLQTAEHVAREYGITREAQDAFALRSQIRTAKAQAAGRFDAEIVPITVMMNQVDKITGRASLVEVTLAKDEGNRPDTTAEGLARLAPVIEGGTVTAGNASQLSDGASACVMMSDAGARQRGLPVLGIYRGMAVAGLAPREMGIGPIPAIKRLLERAGLRKEDIGLWELNEAFACQALYCERFLDIDPDRFNVDGGAISIGHPYGMSGARLIGHALLEGRRRQVRYIVASMCVGGGMGAAALFEITY